MVVNTGTGNQVGEPVVDTIVYQIDGNGSVLGFIYNDEVYYYLKNLQGDIVGIADAAGDVVAEYVYDSWGKLINTPTGIGEINPLRYRGYYYDVETGLYYLNARYYDPETGRFISADSNLAGGLNLFAYCANNPVNLADYNGRDPELIRINDEVSLVRNFPEGANITGFNCYSLALGIYNRHINPGDFCNWPLYDPDVDEADERGAYVSVDDIAERVKRDLLTMGKKAKVKSLAEANVAVRVTSPNRIDKRTGSRGDFDFHFMYKHPELGWSFKAGQGHVYILNDGLDPSNVSWDMYDEVTGAVKEKNAYVGRIIYLKIT